MRDLYGWIRTTDFCLCYIEICWEKVAKEIIFCGLTYKMLSQYLLDYRDFKVTVNLLVRISTKLVTALMLCMLILYMNGKVGLQLNLDKDWQVFMMLFMAIFILIAVFIKRMLRESSWAGVWSMSSCWIGQHTV